MAEKRGGKGEVSIVWGGLEIGRENVGLARRVRMMGGCFGANGWKDRKDEGAGGGNMGTLTSPHCAQKK